MAHEPDTAQRLKMLNLLAIVLEAASEIGPGFTNLKSAVSIAQEVFDPHRAANRLLAANNGTAATHPKPATKG